MATRNLTGQFCALRNSLRVQNIPSDNEPFRKAMEDNPFDVEDPGAGSGKWLPLLDKIRVKEQEIETKIVQLTDLQRQHLKPQFGRNEAEERRQIDQTAGAITDAFRECERDLKNLALAAQSRMQESGEDEDRVLQNVQISLVAQVHKLSLRFRDEQRRFHNDLKRHEQRVQNMGFIGAGEEKEEDELPDCISKEQSQRLSPQEIQAIKDQWDMAKSRDSEIDKIYQSIVDIHEMFKDMNVLVIDQGSLLDRIDYNIHSTKEKVREGNDHLEVALQRAKTGMFSKIVLVLSAIIIALLVIATIKKLIF